MSLVFLDSHNKTRQKGKKTYCLLISYSCFVFILDSKVKRFCSKNILIILSVFSLLAVIALIAVGLTQNKPLTENVKASEIMNICNVVIILLYLLTEKSGKFISTL